MNLALAETKNEIDFIINNTSKQLTWLPINLETLLYVKSKKLEYIDPTKLFFKKDHQQGILEQEKFIKYLKFNKFEHETLNIRFNSIMRKYFNSIFLIITFYENLKKKYKIKQIYVSGNNSYNFSKVDENSIISYICLEIFKKKKINVVPLSSTKLNYQPRYRYLLKDKIKINGPFILISNLDYNFKRFIFFFKKKKIKIAYFEFNKLNIIKKKLFYFLGIIPIIITKKIISNMLIQDSLNLKIKYRYKKYDLSKLLQERANQIFLEIYDLKNKFKVIDEFFSKNKAKLIITNLVRGINGYILEISKKNKIKSISISHGTLTKSYNLYDKIFQRVLSEELISKHSSHIACQSRIALSYLKEANVKNKIIKTGNLIFSQNEKNKKKYILYAVTLRHFLNNHYYGIDTFFEFYNNLDNFNKLAQKHKLNFLIKLHQNIGYLKKDLEKKFASLKFTNERIGMAISKSYATISFSSTSIEDSLYSRVPVVLYDPNQRYKHCKSQIKLNKKNHAVYYTKNISELLLCLKTIKESKNINFNQHIFNGNFKQNISKLISI